MLQKTPLAMTAEIKGISHIVLAVAALDAV
jgi:hypothetical protein